MHILIAVQCRSTLIGKGIEKIGKNTSNKKIEMTFLYLSVGIYELLLLIIPAILWLWVLVDLLKSEFMNSTNKIVWVVVVVFFPFIGALLYLLFGQGQKIRKSKS